MAITVIIAHYAPPKRTAFYQKLLSDTIASIRHQNCNFPIEIIVCDDGSTWSNDLLKSTDEISHYSRDEFKGHAALEALDIDHFLQLPDSEQYHGIILKHRAFEIARYENVLVLDDDHPLIRKKSLQTFHDLLKQYQYVIGRVIGPTGIPQVFMANNAQGTTYAIKKQLYFQYGGFPEFVRQNGYGEDNVLRWQVYDYLSQHYPHEIKAAFAGEIYTRDLASNRWLDRANNNTDAEKAQNTVYKRDPAFIKEFNALFGVNPYRNPSSIRYKWMRMSSLEGWWYEIGFVLIRSILNFPAMIKNMIRLVLKIIRHISSSEGRKKINRHFKK